MAFLPTILLCIIQRFFTVQAGAQGHLCLAQWYYAFQVIFVLFVTIIGRSVLTTLSTLISNPVSGFDLLANNLPYASHFYLNYVVLGWMTLPYEMCRLANLAKYMWYRCFYGLSQAQAKDCAEPEDESYYGMGARVAMSSMNTTTALVFCQVCPVMCFFAFVYFFIGRVTYGYLLVSAETKKPDLGGAFWMCSMSHIHFALVLYAFMMIGIIIDKSKTWGPPFLASISLVILFQAQRNFHALDWEFAPFNKSLVSRAQNMAVTTCAASQESEGAAGSSHSEYVSSHTEYVQPECVASEIWEAK